MKAASGTNRIQNEESIQFILAGHAHVTFKNRATGNRYTFKVVKSKGTKPVHFVNVMYGSDNQNTYAYIGCIFEEKKFKWTVKSKIKQDDVRVKVFEYVFNHLLKGDLVEVIEIWHEGRCGRCGRLLTVPESITSGFGPECAGRVGISILSKPQVVKKEVKHTVGVLFSASTGEPISIPVHEEGVIEVGCSIDKVLTLFND